MNNRLKLILYGGTSFSTLQSFNGVIPRLVEMGVQPIMMFVKDPVSRNQNAYAPQMKEFGFFHSRLMNETIIPFMDARDPILDSTGKPKKNITYTPRQLTQIYAYAGVQAYQLDSVNSPEHADFVLDDPNIVLGVSEKCREIFGDRIINAYRSKKNLPGDGIGHLMNIHPGRLPQYRGLLPIPRAMMQGKRYIETTIHAIEEGGVQAIDTGTVYGSAQQEVDLSRSVLEHYSDTSKAIPSMIVKQVDDIINHGAPLEQVQQNQSEAQYYTWLTPEELDEMKNSGVNLVGAPKDEARFLTRAFANGSHHGPQLRAVVDSAVNEEYGRPVSEPVEGYSVRPSGLFVAPHRGLTPLGAVA